MPSVAPPPYTLTAVVVLAGAVLTSAGLRIESSSAVSGTILTIESGEKRLTNHCVWGGGEEADARRHCCLDAAVPSLARQLLTRGLSPTVLKGKIGPDT